MLYKPGEFYNYMVVRQVGTGWWNHLISNPLVVQQKTSVPLVIWGKPKDTVELTDDRHMRCIADNVEEIYALPVDVDNGTTMANFERDFHRYSYQLYTTHSWQNGKPGERFRVFFPLKEPIKVKWMVKPVKDKLMELFSMADSSCFDRGHWQKLPAISRADAPYRYVQHSGEMLSFAYENLERIADEYNNDMLAKRKKMEEDRDPNANHDGMLNYVQNVFDATTEGSRDKTVYNKVKWLIDMGCSYEEVISLRPPFGFDREYELKVNRLFGVR